ncbi:hypothetical protein BDZ45DRAFT_812191 [Acephala macrosclerotiorum]|nr:hypothetical protein BDZ45DRAFT_812191 [Acephala macrosclerotiorum]
MAEARKTTNTQSPTHSVESREVEIPTGWKYKSLKLGPITLPWYASPESQLILVSFVCFLCPGMFNALNGLGGAGQLSANASDASNSALYATFAVVGFFAGTVVNVLGVKIALSFSGLGYCIYVSSYLCYNHTHNFGNLRRHFFEFALDAVSQRRRSAQALLTLASPSTQVAQSRSCFPFQ